MLHGIGKWLSPSRCLMHVQNSLLRSNGLRGRLGSLVQLARDSLGDECLTRRGESLLVDLRIVCGRSGNLVDAIGQHAIIGTAGLGTGIELFLSQPVCISDGTIVVGRMDLVAHGDAG